MTQPPPHQQPYPGAAQPHQYPQQQAYQQPYQPAPQAYQQPAPQQHPQGQQGRQGPWPADYQQQPYQAPQQAPWQPQGAPQPGPQEHGLVCRVCGSGPAARATFRAVVGALVMHTIWTATGPFCRDCGLETCRRQTNKTLAGGWFSVGAIILTPIFLTMNLVARGKISALPAPQRYVRR